jgi:short-subunit dehydrogenase
MKLMSPEQCVAEGLAALSANRATHIAGRMNRLLAAVMPRSMVSSMFGKMMHRVVVTRSSSAEAPTELGNERQASRTS